jgi:1-deoxy-D-xylulose-5-phosphate reductoisomerase
VITTGTNLVILGSTGSIGVSTLDVVARHPDRFRVVALTARRDVDGLAGQCQRFRPRFAVMSEPAAAEQLRKRLASEAPDTQVLAGADALSEVAALPEAQVVMAGIVGAAGLLPTFSAVRAGKRVLLANKEALVMSGAVFMAALSENGAELIPVDSEHNAVFQCFPSDKDSTGVRRIILTASGGPFREMPGSQLESVTPEQACNHPNWDMGRKISVDSATLMNKGLEVIEAHWLFGADPDCIEVVVHPQSVIHSMVEYADGSVLAHLGHPDMRTPIAHALAWPERIEAGVMPLEFARLQPLTFEEPDLDRFPCLRLGYEALNDGGTAPAVLNAANEVAVEAFLNGVIGFGDIPRLIENVRGMCVVEEVSDLDGVLAADRAARAQAVEEVERMKGTVMSRKVAT